MEMQKATGNHCIKGPKDIPRIIFSMIETNQNTAPSPRQPFNGQGVLRIPGSVMKKIATWNVRSMFESGKTHNTISEMKRLKIDVLGVSEIRWQRNGVVRVEDHYIYYSGNEDAQHWNGVGFLVGRSVCESVKIFIPISDRVCILQLNTAPIATNLIQVYAPTCDRSDDEVETFYDDIKRALTLTKSSKINIIMGDLNAKVGEGRREDIVGDYGLGRSNERGDRLIQFCQENDLIITNTHFKQHPRRLYTWISNADRDVRNQIDFIIINRRFRNIIQNAKTYPGADVFTDHSLLAATLKLKLKKCKEYQAVQHIDTRKLLDPAIRTEVQEELNSRLGNMHQTIEEDNIENTWREIKTSIVEVSHAKLKSNRTKHKTWITDDILKLMDHRRSYKNKDPSRYKEIQKEVRAKIRKAKEEWLAEQCNEIEQLEVKHDSFNMYKKIRKITGQYKKSHNNILMNEQHQILSTTEEQLQEWKKYIENLFVDNRSPAHGGSLDDGIDITKAELMHALSTAKNGRAPGPDDVQIEVLKTLDGDRPLTLLLNLLNCIYRTGVIPHDWLGSTFVAIPKKTNSKCCADYRTISLMSHVLKLFLRIIHSRIYTKCEENIGKSQFGFRSGFGTREALFSIQVLIQRCRDVNVDVYACFVDYEKAFDTVQHDKLIDILNAIGLDGRDIRIIANLYWNQTANIKVNGQTSEDVPIMKGVRQGCVLSPLLFNLYAETIFSEALEERTEGIIANGIVINNLRYADDTVLLATDKDDLQALLAAVTDHSQRMGLRLNIRKTKWLVVSKNKIITDNLTDINVYGEIVERVPKYKYLGCWVNEEWDLTQEIRSRIEQARTSFKNMQKVLTNRSLRISLRIRLLRCYVFSILFYGMEAWTLTEAMCKRIEAFEMWAYRRMLRISWMDRVTNEAVLQRMNKEREVLNTIKRRKLEYFAHVMRNPKYELLHIVIQGKIEGRRNPGRRRTSWLKNLRQWYGVSTTTLFRTAADKVKIMRLIANVLGGHGT